MSKSYSIPLNEIYREHVFIDSRFNVILAPVFTAEEAREFIRRMKKEFADASHNVPTYLLALGTRSPSFVRMMVSLQGHRASLR